MPYIPIRPSWSLIGRLGVGICLNWGIANDWLTNWLRYWFVWCGWFELIDLIWFDLQDVMQGLEFGTQWHHFIANYYIPLWSNRKFRNLYRRATHNTPTSDSELFSNFSLVSLVYRTLNWWNQRFPYWIRKEFQRTEWLKSSSSKSGRFRTSGSTFWTEDSRPIWLRSDGLTKSLSTTKTL